MIFWPPFYSNEHHRAFEPNSRQMVLETHQRMLPNLEIIIARFITIQQCQAIEMTGQNLGSMVRMSGNRISSASLHHVDGEDEMCVQGWTRVVTLRGFRAVHFTSQKWASSLLKLPLWFTLGLKQMSREQLTISIYRPWDESHAEAPGMEDLLETNHDLFRLLETR